MCISRFCMKSLHIARLFVVAAAALSQMAHAADPVKFNRTYELNSSVKHKVDLQLNIGGLEGNIKFNVATKVTKVSPEKVESTAIIDEVTAEVGGSDPGIQAGDLVREYNDKRDIVNVTGGIQGSDPFRLALTLEFFAPAEALTEGKEVTQTLAENKTASIKALKIVTKLVGKEKVGETEGFKVVQKITEEGEGGLTTESTFIVLENGKILSVDAKFTNMPIPAAGQSATGSIKAKIVE